MDLFTLVGDITAYLQANLVVSVAAGILILLLLYRKPKLALTLLGVALVLIVVLSLVSNLSSSGASHKNRMGTSGQIPDR